MLAPQNQSFSYENPYIFTLLMGVDLSLNILNRRDCRTPADASESMIFLRKSIHFHSANGANVATHAEDTIVRGGPCASTLHGLNRTL